MILALNKEEISKICYRFNSLQNRINTVLDDYEKTKIEFEFSSITVEDIFSLSPNEIRGIFYYHSIVLFANKQFPPKFLEDLSTILNSVNYWTLISRYQILSEEFIMNNLSSIDFDALCKNKYISKDIIERAKQYRDLV
jgi:hypothetical protein